MDDLDKKIIGELQKDARVAFRRISELHGISIGTVHNRLKKLKEDGLLKGFVPVLDNKKLGYTIIALVYIKVEGGHLQEIKNTLADFSEINVIFQTSGIYDLVLIARFQNMIDFSNFNNKISKLTNMKAETNIVLDTLKDDYFLKLASAPELPGESI
jgi:Lrp/AsnC family transcriptional regulator for asnA, asnC and gidA